MAERVRLFEVGPRDGLQNETNLIPTEDKIRLVDLLSDCGLDKIEVTSFVSPKWVPQMADAAEVMAGITRKPGIAYTALTPNMRGLEGARDAGAQEIAVFGSASEGFSQANINCSIEESLSRFTPVVETSDVPVRGYVSCVTDCPFDGPTAPQDVAKVAAGLIHMGCYEVSLGDTIGRGTPGRVAAMLDAVLKLVPASQLAGHFHDTSGQALANIDVCLEAGIRVFDGAVGGLGGCPYAPGAAGNVASEAVVAMLHARGFVTGVDEAKLRHAAGFAKRLRCDHV